MSIRIRVVNGITVALCAARSVAKPGDIYLDDSAHYALARKFEEDLHSMGYYHGPLSEMDSKLRSVEESNNANRRWWDSVYGPKGSLAESQT